ncbi:MAG: ribosome biogenesis GTP-binding protein YihA/YsxC [Lentimicrobiaceae bacterium]|nr:ribosome biogenesis GTP-binding protein YihA/YsxC [Lentimicrobiaceae bacterium]
MQIRTAIFVKSSPTWQQCPPSDLPEYAFIGRSNVGKSSLINMLCNHNNLAKTSSKPGKTQLINHFLIDNAWHLVDLPGYGYAKTSKKIREGLSEMISQYILNRPQLVCLFVLIDSRLAPQQIDLDFLYHLGENQIPFALIFTKSDKQSPTRTRENVSNFLNVLSENWETPPPYFISSCITKEGKEEIAAYIGGFL